MSFRKEIIQGFHGEYIFIAFYSLNSCMDSILWSGEGMSGGRLFHLSDWSSCRRLAPSVASCTAWNHGNRVTSCSHFQVEEITVSLSFFSASPSQSSLTGFRTCSFISLHKRLNASLYTPWECTGFISKRLLRWCKMSYVTYKMLPFNIL